MKRYTTDDNVIYVTFPRPPEADDRFVMGPLDYQVEFIKSSAAIKLALWGVGTGKSAMGAFHTVLTCLDNDGMRALAVSPTNTMINDVLIPLLEDIAETWEAANGFKLYTHHKTQNLITFHNGSKLFLRSGDRPNKLRGPTVGFIWLDETSVMPDEEAVWEVCVGRLRGRGPRQIIITSTPMGDVGIIGHVLQEWRAGTPGYFVQRKTSYDNPYLPDDYIPRMKAAYSPEFFEQEVLARVLKVTGLMYPEFDQETHLCDFDPATELRNGWEIIVGVDWGYGHSHAVYCAVRENVNLPYPEVVVFDEFGLDGKSDEEMIKAIIQRMNKFPMLPIGFAPDFNGTEANRDLRKALRNIGAGMKLRVEMDHKKRRVWRSVEMVRRLLRTSERKICLRFAKSLLQNGMNAKGQFGVVESIENYRRKSAVVGRSFKDEPYDDNRTAHSMDALRYVVMNLQKFGFKLQYRVARAGEVGVERGIYAEEATG